MVQLFVVLFRNYMSYSTEFTYFTLQLRIKGSNFKFKIFVHDNTQKFCFLMDIIWSKTYKTKLTELDILYKKVSEIAVNVDVREASVEVHKTMSWLPLHVRRQLHLSAYMYRILNENCPRHFIGKFSYISGG